MGSHDGCRWTASRWAAVVVAACAAAGCKSDLSQQLLERELRYQEDQIYQLQDELQEKCARLDMLSGENASLPIEAPELPRSAAPPAGPLAPPSLDGVPPLPDRSEAVPPAPETVPALPVSDGEAPLSLPPAAMKLDPAARPAAVALPGDDVRRLSFETAQPTHVVVTVARTACVDADGDGTSEGLKVVFEPRDAEERLAAAAGDVEITAFAADGGTTLGTWRIAAAEVAGGFRPTGRDRGVSLTLPWQVAPPAGGHVRVAVRFTVPGAAALEADALIPSR